MVIKKKFLIMGMLILFTGLVIGAWFFEYDKSIKGEVVATGKKLHIIFDLNNFSINTSTGILVNSQNLTIDNKKDPRMVNFTITINKTLTEPMCPDYESDCVVEFFNETNIIPNGTSYIIPKDILTFTLNTTCEAYSCGQNISVRVEIKE